MRYHLSKREIAQPIDIVARRAHSRHLDAPAKQSGQANQPNQGGREPTTGDLERLGDGELESVIVAKRFNVRRLLGRGGMASVYAAYDAKLGRPVALKILSEDYCGHPQILARFLREVRLNARLHHPNIVEVVDFGASCSGVIFLAMELLEGEDLRRTLARRTSIPWPRARELMLQICAGLEAAHAAGIVHRDLKPSNCFRVVDSDDESIRLVDFGIATSVDESASQRLTLNNHIIGTPEYMSPEQARGEQVDPRSDIYSAGLILGELLTGSLPFRAATPPAMLAAQIYEPPPRLGSLAPPGSHIPAAVEAIYARALSKDPNQRYPDVEAFATALRGVEAGGPILVSGAYTVCPVAPDTRVDVDTATISTDTRWHPYAAASIAFVVGALGALAVASSFDSTPAVGSPTPTFEAPAELQQDRHGESH